MSAIPLYVLATEYRAAAAKLADLDLDAATVTDTLESITGPLQDKVMNVAMFIRGLDGTIAAMKSAEASLASRRKSAEARREHVAKYLIDSMTACDLTNVANAMLRVTVRNNPERAEVFDPNKLPASYMRLPPPPPTPDPVPDLTAIRDDLKAGVLIPGAKLVQGVRLEMK